MADPPPPDTRLQAQSCSSGNSPSALTQPNSRDSHWPKRLKRPVSKHLRIDGNTRSPSASIYTGSYVRSNHGSLRHGCPSPRTSISHLQLEHLLTETDEDIETYGIHETKDGFFDVFFSRPKLNSSRKRGWEDEGFDQPQYANLAKRIQEQFDSQWRGLTKVYEDITTTRTGIRLLKAFLGVFIAYIICLIPAVRRRFGKYFYIIIVSAIVNHPARSVGSQIDGAVLSTVGTLCGLLWGGLAIYTSDSTYAATRGYGAAMVPFLFLFTSVLGFLRCVYNRLFQAIICAGIASFFMCLSENQLATANPTDIWYRLQQFIVAWTLGQALCLLICTTVFPSAGNRPLVASFHSALKCVQKGLVLPRPASLTLSGELAEHFVNISQAVRDFTLDLSFSTFTPDDARSLRNLIQGVVRSIRAIQPDTLLFEARDTQSSADTALEPSRLIADTMAQSTRNLIDHLNQALEGIAGALMHISGLHGHTNPEICNPRAVSMTIKLVNTAIKEFDAAEASIASGQVLPKFSIDHSEVVDLFVFIHAVRQAAGRVVPLLDKILEMSGRKLRRKLQLPSYPLSKALLRMNPTVRHDRGGLMAGFYFQSKRLMEKTIDELQSRDWKPLDYDTLNSNSQVPRKASALSESDFDLRSNNDKFVPVGSSRVRNYAWLALHRMQDFEARFALKITLVCTLVSIPALLPQMDGWWYVNDCWWVCVTIWIMMHPRVGGNLNDLIIRTSCAALGAIWAGVASAASSGDPYVMAVFAAIYLLPMVYRYTQSVHPRSGFIGCLSFVVVSMENLHPHPDVNTFHVVWTRGLVFVAGCVTAIIVNWILWPFVARHELRKSIATMILHSAIIYRRVIGIYMYFDEGHAPGKEDIERSEILEGRLREGFVRFRQLMDLTKHEIRLREPFDSRPYGAMINVCEEFFDRVVEVRQSSLYFRPDLVRQSDDLSHNPIASRRDAVAAILMNLYILAGALRSNKPLPPYMPSAAYARRRLLDTMAIIEDEKERVAGKGVNKHPRNGKERWEDVYRYAYSSALTDIVAQVQELEAKATDIVGAMRFPSASHHE